MCFGKYQTWWRNLFHITQAWRSIKLVRRVCLQFMRHHYMCTKNCLYIVIALSLIHKFVISFYKCTHLVFYKLCQLKTFLHFSIKIFICFYTHRISIIFVSKGFTTKWVEMLMNHGNRMKYLCRLKWVTKMRLQHFLNIKRLPFMNVKGN